MDSSGRLLSVHIRFPGIRGNDCRVLSRRVVDEMLAAFRELSRDAGRESNRRADAQAAEMDSSGRLLGVHIRFLGIRGNERRVSNRSGDRIKPINIQPINTCNPAAPRNADARLQHVC